jgi:hypothetical protein
VIYGAVAVIVALASEFYFLLMDPSQAAGWIVAIVESYRTQLAFAAFIVLGILAALRARPVRTDSETPYRSLLVRDGALAATIVGVMVAVVLFVSVALEATVFSGALREYASGAAPRIVSYIQELSERFSAPPQPVSEQQIEHNLQPPSLGYLGRSIFNGVLRAMLMGAIGAVIGSLRGRFGGAPQGEDKG